MGDSGKVASGVLVPTALPFWSSMPDPAPGLIFNVVTTWGTAFEPFTILGIVSTICRRKFTVRKAVSLPNILFLAAVAFTGGNNPEKIKEGNALSVNRIVAFRAIAVLVLLSVPVASAFA